MIQKRYLQPAIRRDLNKKMVLIGGPRQVGKTTMAQHIGEQAYPSYTYFNWDNPEHRRILIKGTPAVSTPLLILDEIHKYKKWKNYVKGIFDVYKDEFNILITGSARLDIYRRGGDSMFGRYHYFRLHPFSLAELTQPGVNKIAVWGKLNFPKTDTALRQTFNQLYKFGGFPEPFLAEDEADLRRFHNEKRDLLVRQDIRDLEQVRDLSTLEALAIMLPDKVGSLLSLNALRGDLEVSHKTVSGWMDILERSYYHFRLRPFASTAIKSLRKEPKLYLWDWSEVIDESARLENLVASHLLKFVHYLHDTAGHQAELFFLRDIEGREVDFLVTVDRRPWFGVEFKVKDEKPATSLRYFRKKLSLPFSFQVVKAGGVDVVVEGIRVISVDKFLAGLV